MQSHKFLILIVCLSPFFGKSQNSTVIGSYLGVHGGCTIYEEQSMTDLNRLLYYNQIAPLPYISYSSPYFTHMLGIDYSLQFGRSDVNFNTTVQNMSNRSNEENTKAAMNLITVTANYGYDLLGLNKRIRLEPFLGVGISTIQLLLKNLDSSNEFAVDIMDMDGNYSDWSSLGLNLNGGLRFELYPKKFGSNMSFFTQAEYQWQVNNYKWNSPHIEVPHLYRINFSVGLRFRITSGKNCTQHSS